MAKLISDVLIFSCIAGPATGSLNLNSVIQSDIEYQVQTEKPFARQVKGIQISFRITNLHDA